jgi:hypothetical protein
LTNDVIYDFNLYINYWNCISLLNYYADDIYQHTFIIPLIDCNKDGLGKIEFFIDVSVATNMILYLDNIGIYVNGSSISSEFAYLRSIALATNTWNFNENNLFSFNLTGNSSFHVSSYPYLHEISTLTEINSLDYYNGSYFFNIYDLLHDTNSYCQYPMIWIEFYNQFQFYELNIEGVILTDGFNDYNLEYSHKYVDINQNYFYVDNNRLYFSLDLNESSYEGITGLFDIPNHSTINASIVYNSYYTGVINPYLCINYTDLTTLIGYYDFKSYYTTTRFLLPQNLYIDKIFINCSDFIPYAESYTNYINGQITGFIDSISLKFIRNIDYSITVITLISGFIPLIVMFTPSIALYSKFGKKILVPSLILMSIVCIVGSLIPLWLFSLLIVIFGYLLLVSKYDEGI